ncbi:MAG: FliH/SctL family protein [Abditibacteriales bacterium]|nr:FliH/SctL family protein [Abditibacteriales bacterium]MDW8365991.1 FliH/SctL family protein [Abditibacteriales bacterium]
MRSSRKVIKTARLSGRLRHIPFPEEPASEEIEPSPSDTPIPEGDVIEDQISSSHQEDDVIAAEECANADVPHRLPVEPPASPPSLSTEEVERLRAQAWEEGRREGFAAGKQEAAQLLALLRGVVEEAMAARETFIAITTPQLLNLAVQIAEKIVRREVERDATVVQRIAEDALRHAVDKHHLRIRVHPDDLATLQALAPELRAALEDVREFEIVPDRRRGDRRMMRGGCLIETESGVIDARIETQLEEIHERLMEECPDGQFVLGGGDPTD